MAGFIHDEILHEHPIETAKLRAVTAGVDLLDLANANPTSAGILFPQAALAKAFASAISSRRYEPHPRGLFAARLAIHEYYRRRWGERAPRAEHIFITASTSEAYRLVFSLLCEPGDRVLVPNPSYPLLDFIALDQRVELSPYELQLKTQWEIPKLQTKSEHDELIRAAVLISPHNPTGANLSKLSAFSAESELPLIVDEVFSEFSWHSSSGERNTPDLTQNPIFIVNGISKMLALPDCKLAWIALSPRADELYGERLEFLNDTYLSCSTLVQSALPALLEERLGFTQLLRRTYQENLDFFAELLLKFPEITLPQPTAGTFCFPQLPDNIDEEGFIISLIENGFYTHPGSFFGPLNTKHFLLSAVQDPTLLRSKRHALETAIATALRSA